ncbi:hypothetical protein GGF42_001736 [Coemansia sp. RSA 2424]|nr:hypothetical protein GGF42_001736 [Coemansia sp. RSA 2424]
MAVVIRLLVEAGLFCQLLDFILWVLDHTTAVSVLSLSHRVLRRYTRVWKQLGKLSMAVAAIDKVRKEAGGGSEAFDFELYRTAQHWASGCADGRALAEQAQRDYDCYANLHASSLLQGGHATLPASASKDILQLAQQLVRERTREPSGSDEAEWAITPCFQKLGRWAQSATQRGGDFTASPAIMQHDMPSSPPGGAAARLPRLQAMLAHIVADATQAALVTGRTLPLASSGAADRVRDEALLRCFVEMCAQLVRWFAVCSGLALSPDYIGPLVLKAMATAIGSWTLTRSSPPPSVLTAPAPTAPMLLESEIEVGMHVSYIWVNCLLASGCLRLDELIPWLIEMCREEPTQQNLAQYTCLAGIVYALGMPVQQQGESRASLAGDANNGSNGGDDYSVSCDLRHMYELLEIGSSWQAALDGNRLCRIQAIELVFTSASASGRLRGLGAPRLATTLMRATTALAQSEWVMAIVDYIPFSHQKASDKADSQHGPYYSMLEIYQANIEGQIHDPAIVLPVKRAILRVLMTLCEGADPASEGFSAMTTAEVAHRLRETMRRFWYGPAARGSRAAAAAAASKLATILNSLLLFASTALQESEASTDAFAVAAGAKAIAGGVREEPRSGDIDCGGAHRSHDSEQVQFVTNTMAYLSTCVLDAAYNWGGGGDDLAMGSKSLIGQRCASLAEALCTLSPGVLLTLIESCVGSLFSLSSAKLRNTTIASVESAEQPRPPAAMGQGPSATGLDERVAALVCAFSTDASCLLEINTADYSGMELDDASGDIRNDDAAASFAAYSERGSALAKLIQQLVQRLGLHIDTGSGGDQSFAAGGSALAALRDLASAILGQIQAICMRINPVAATQLSLQACSDRQVASLGSQSTSACGGGAEEADADILDSCRLRAALCWRLQAVQPMCNLFRQFPDEFGVGEWLITLVTLCLAPACHPLSSSSPDAESSDELYQFLLDFAAVTNESTTPAMRKLVLGSLRLAAPLLRSAIQSTKRAEVLGRLFPFDTTIVPTSDIQPLVSAAHGGIGLDNPWVWIEALEFVPLASLNSSAIANAGLEGITPFTLRGTLQQEAASRSSGALRPPAGGSSGFGLVMRSSSATSLGSRSTTTTTTATMPHRLQYLENPYFPMQPSFIFPLAETPLPWLLFGGKRRRLDSESRLVWRSLCESTFAPSGSSSF